MLPLDAGNTRVVFDYFLDRASAAARGGGADSEEAFVKASLAASDVVQAEDEALCLGVQAGLGSRAYTAGRYAPALEGPMHEFHRRLHADYARFLEGQQQQ